MNPYFRETIESWIGDFCDSAGYAALPHGIKGYAPEILVTFISHAVVGDDMESLDEGRLKSGLLDGVGSLAIPASVRPEVPGLCRAFLEDLEDRGRLGGGANLGRYVGALRDAYLEAAGPTRPLSNPGERLGRNDPCPCGSGRKYKKCCMRLLD